AGGEELGMIHLRPALTQRDLQPVFLIEAGGERLVIAAMFGLGLPIGAERDLIERPFILCLGRCGDAAKRERRAEKTDRRREEPHHHVLAAVAKSSRLSSARPRRAAITKMRGQPFGRARGRARQIWERLL